MRIPTFAIFLACVLFPLAPAAGADDAQPRKLDREALAGGAFADPSAVVKQEQSERGPYTTRDLEAFRSDGGHFDAGVYASGPARIPIAEPYGVDEFMYFLEGGVTLTSRDGRVLEVAAGEAVIIPKAWRGVWETEGYTKIYVIYSPDRPIE
jgi:uncharacterized cupin superfamily protein